MRDLPIIALQEKDEAVNLMITESLHWYTKQVSDFETYDFQQLPKGDFIGEIL
ncbi:Purine trans deoxyribosylase (Nucleoside deoxyribosyltransferase-I) [Lactiplantibacillus plantarum]|nr:Purine trans deoxyribosylase (Nucleoside deoxyribosyltransferase-I) [Lactiplantibacillus plantarum]